MKAFFRGLLVAPAAIVILAFAFANRQVVSVSFDPFQGMARGFKIDAPLFLVLFATVMVGVVVGGVATWLSQAKHRRAERRYRREAARLARELARLEGEPRAMEPLVPAFPDSHAA